MHLPLPDHRTTAEVSHGEVIPLPLTRGTPEDVPEPQRLICSRRHNATPIWALVHVEDLNSWTKCISGGSGENEQQKERDRVKVHSATYPRGVALELLDLRHGGVFPQDQLVLAEPVARADLPLVLRPQQGAHLAPRVDRVQHRAGVGVPELDRAIGRPSPGRQQAASEGTPRQGLHGRLVMREGEAGSEGREVPPGRAPAPSPRTAAAGHGRVPQAEEVLVPPGREGAPLVVPLQPAHLLRVPDVRAHDVIAAPDVVLDDARVSSPGAKPVLVPAQRAHAGCVAVQGPQPSLGGRVPQLDDVVVRPHGDVVAVPLVPDPRDARDEVRLLPEREQVADVPRVGLPEVHALPQRHGQDVGLAPAHEVEVVVVHQLGGVEDPGGGFGDPTPDALGRRAQPLLGLGEGVDEPGRGPRASAAGGAAGVGCGAVQDVKLVVGEGVHRRRGGREAVVVTRRGLAEAVGRGERREAARGSGGLARQSPSGRGQGRREGRGPAPGRDGPLSVVGAVVQRARARGAVRGGGGMGDVLLAGPLEREHALNPPDWRVRRSPRDRRIVVVQGRVHDALDVLPVMNARRIRDRFVARLALVLAVRGRGRSARVGQIPTPLVVHGKVQQRSPHPPVELGLEGRRRLLPAMGTGGAGRRPARSRRGSGAARRRRISPVPAPGVRVAVLPPGRQAPPPPLGLLPRQLLERPAEVPLRGLHRGAADVHPQRRAVGDEPVAGVVRREAGAAPDVDAASAPTPLATRRLGRRPEQRGGEGRRAGVRALSGRRRGAALRRRQGTAAESSSPSSAPSPEFARRGALLRRRPHGGTKARERSSSSSSLRKALWVLFVEFVDNPVATGVNLALASVLTAPQNQTPLLLGPTEYQEKRRGWPASVPEAEWRDPIEEILSKTPELFPLLQASCSNDKKSGNAALWIEASTPTADQQADCSVWD
ncbi:hypothetical protein ACHAWF_010326 [Thalassiosira exigua]